MQTEIKKFNQLTTDELYELLQLRSEVFVVEQDCVYQDVDGKDQKALHIIGRVNDKIVAYTRCFAKGDYFNKASIGRVVVDLNHRKDGLGYKIMEESITAIYNHFGEQAIKVSAQTYLSSFYNSLGFISEGTSYLEDGIPHIAMVKP
ncbi:MAG: GNAT family N-acetyltransferase [Gilvibacter sp.]